MRRAHMWGMHIAMMGFRTRLSSEYPTGTHGFLLDHLYFQTNMFRICSSINLHDVPEHPVHFVPVSSQLYIYGKIHLRVMQQCYIIISAEACRGIPSLLHRVRFASVHGRPEALRKAYKPGIQELPPPLQYWGRLIYPGVVVLPPLIKHWALRKAYVPR